MRVLGVLCQESGAGTNMHIFYYLTLSLEKVFDLYPLMLHRAGFS